MRLKIVFFSLVILSLWNGLAQVPVQFSKPDIFESNYFIPNLGQFDNNKSGLPFLYKLENGENQVSLLSNGFIWHTYHYENARPMAFFYAGEETDIEDKNLVWRDIVLQWLGKLNKAVITASAKSAHIFSYGDAQKNSCGYKKILYKNLYSNADIEYTTNAKGGINYTIILKPGSNIADIKFKYSGEKVKVQFTDSVLFIKNPDGSLKECGLTAYYEGGERIPCKYKMENGQIGFEFGVKADTRKTIIIDPWITKVSTLTGTGKVGYNIGYDVDYDFDGNVYVFGGGIPNCKLAKYNAAGVLQWTFNGKVATFTFTWTCAGIYPANFAVQHNTGKVYIGNVNLSTGAQIIRLDKNGVYDNYITKSDGTFKEIWEMTTDCNSGRIFGMGGSTASPQNIGAFDNAGNFTAINCTGITNSNLQDIVSSAMDLKGTLFLLFASNATPKVNNAIFKLNSTYTSPDWTAPTGYGTAMVEARNKNFLTTSGEISNGFNALAVNGNYLFYYDGAHLKAFNKMSGTTVGNAKTLATASKMQGGIYADECNNVYIGGNNGKLDIYYFDGLDFVAQAPLDLPAWTGKRVYDIKYNRGSNLIYVTGDSFVAAVSPSMKCEDTATLNATLLITTQAQCSKTAYANIQYYDTAAYYSFIWIDSTTGLTMREKLHVKKSADTLAKINSSHRFILRVTKDALCNGGIKIFKFDGNKTLFNVNICQGDFAVFNGKKYSVAGNYFDTIKLNKQCDSMIEISLKVIPKSYTNLNPVICEGKYFKTANSMYSQTGSYFDTLINTKLCDSIIKTTLKIKPKTYFTQNKWICRYEQVIVGNKKYSLPGIYYDTFTNYLGCDSVAKTQIQYSPPVNYASNQTICEGDIYQIGKHQYMVKGVYYDTFITAKGCDSVMVTSLYVNPKTYKTQEFSLCAGDSLLVGKKIYKQSGQYFDVIKNYYGCDSVITTKIIVNPLPLPEITGPKTLCVLDKDEITLSTGFFNKYYWLPNNETTREIVVSIYGNYTVKVTNNFGCENVATRAVISDCSPRIYIPDAFTPNANGPNDIFRPSVLEYKKYLMVIYNRWGEKLFTTNSVELGWDGVYNNKSVADGVYVYRITLTGNDDLDYNYRGVFTLLR